MSHLLSCFLCGERFDSELPRTVCDCGRPLRVELDGVVPREALAQREPTLWRYREALPDCEPVTLGEGMTPLIPTPCFGRRWFIKDEALNPTASFKSRGMSLAISMAKRYGIRKVAAPSAGNAGGALAAYAAAAGMEATVVMPSDTPRACILEAECHGARVVLHDGLITDCGTVVMKMQQEDPSIFNVATLREPYRIEGKKTMGYELAEQLQWRLPDVIVYPAGGGTGLIGMWKAFDEMERMGWIGASRPRMVVVQASGCAPIVRAFRRGDRFAEEAEDAYTVAAGLRVPRTLGDFIILDVLRASSGTAVTVSDEEMIACAKEIAKTVGVFACPEGGAALAAARLLTGDGWIKPDDVVVLFNTASGVKYAEALS
jgi:threonine synthase